MKRVLYLINHAGKAGTERYVYSLMEKLHQKKVQVYLAYNEGGLLVERAKSLGVETFQLSMRHPFDWKAVRQLANICRQNKIDLIHTQFLRENYIAILSRLYCPSVKVIYTSHFIMENNILQNFCNALLTPFEHKIISVCTKGKEQLVHNWIQRDKIEVIFNGVDPLEWGTNTESSLREELKLPKDHFVILCSSRFAHDKGHQFLIRGMEELKKIANAPFTCVLSNDGPLFSEIQAKTKELGLEEEIVFLGFRQDVKNLLYGCDVYLNTSEHEALSFAIIEAMACGVPVIAADMGGNRDIINENTACGELVPYDDSVALAKSIHELMSNVQKRNAYKLAALKATKEVFSLDVMVKKTYTIYQEIFDLQHKGADHTT